MQIAKIGIRNFRLLESVELALEKGTTVIVGRNNSGKTSLTEIFRRILGDNKPSFRMEDFSLSVQGLFWEAFQLREAGGEEMDIREKLPVIEVMLHVRYEKDLATLGPLGEFVIDLDPDCDEACIQLRYQPSDGKIQSLFSDIKHGTKTTPGEKRREFFRAIRERIPHHYESQIWAIDPNDTTNRKQLEWAHLRATIQGGFINAQRGLDDVTHRDRAVLGKILEDLLRTASSKTADPKDKDIAEKLEEAVKEIQSSIDKGFNEQLESLIPAFSIFGYPGFKDPGLKTETILNVERLLTDHTRVHYTGIEGVNLPEGYNGLGARNLIFILLKLIEFYKFYLAMPVVPCVHLVFIEEPEVHLHPQMQEVFIAQINSAAKTFQEKLGGAAAWPVQFVVTTHSSHLANKAPFDAMRYFLAEPKQDNANLRGTKIKDLRQGLDGTGTDDREFLHKYMTLTRCDLLFADAAVLIEGPTERILFPAMVAKIDTTLPPEQKISSRYISVVEVGGAYAHLFFKLLTFLEVRTLIITDLDSVDAGKEACWVSKGVAISNASIKAWFGGGKPTPAELIIKGDARTNGRVRIAYQIPESGVPHCGRSFEQAFILANLKLFGLDACPTHELEGKSWNEAATAGKKKSDFALRFAIQEQAWEVPLYIREGLLWLVENTPVAALPAVFPPAKAKKQAKAPSS